MINIQYFTSQASVDAKWANRRNRTPLYSPLPHSIRQRGSDVESPAFKAPPGGIPGNDSPVGTCSYLNYHFRGQVFCSGKCQRCVRFPKVGGGRVCHNTSSVVDEGGESSVESGNMNSPGSSSVVDREGVSLVESGEVVPPDIPPTLSQFEPLNPRQSLVAMSSEGQVVVKSPITYEAPVGSLDISPAADGMVKSYPVQSQVPCLVIGPVVTQQSAGGLDL